MLYKDVSTSSLAHKIGQAALVIPLAAIFEENFSMNIKIKYGCQFLNAGHSTIRTYLHIHIT